MARAIIIVLDGVGIGELPDAKKYNDVGSNTLMNIKKKVLDLKLKNLCHLGLGNIDGNNLYKNDFSELDLIGSYGKCAEKSCGKDTTTGHWEISGAIVKKAFPVYPNGFPNEIISKFENEIGRRTLGNYPSSGTKIINDLGDEHVKTGAPIIYTSADSVFQIAAHEKIINLEELYKICETARRILTGEHAVGRVIARPFIGESKNYVRTKNRRDFSLEPIGKTLLDYVKENGLEVAAVGKIEDIFCGRGITKKIHTHENSEGIDATIDYLKQDFSGLIFTNLVDYDMLYGHRNDVLGFAQALKYFDDRLPEILACLKPDDLLFITADHGCDPTTKSTDHSREYTPLLVHKKNIKKINLHVRETYADIAKTIADYLKINNDLAGQSFLDMIF